MTTQQAIALVYVIGLLMFWLYLQRRRLLELEAEVERLKQVMILSAQNDMKKAELLDTIAEQVKKLGGSQP